MTPRHGTFALAAALAVFAVPALAETAPAGADPHAAQLDSLRRSAIVLRTIDPTDERYDNLEPLRTVLRGRRVVILGEATHGEGSTFLAKTRILQFLHRELGFDVLAWETGFYDARLTWRALRAGEEPLTALRLGLVPIWSESEQLRPLGDYLASRALSEHPLELVGLDTHVAAVMRGEEVRRHLHAELLRLNAMLGELAAPGEALADLELLARPQGRTPERVARALALLEGVRSGLWRPDLAAALGSDETQWWRQALATMAHKLRAVDAVEGEWEPGTPMAPFFNPRDEQLGANLVWLARERYPERKIAVWTATMHGQKRPEILDASAHQVDYAGVAPMGRYAAQALGDELYVLGFVSYSGEAHLPWRPAEAVPPAPDGSFEALAYEAGLDHAWIDLAGAPSDSWLRGTFTARPLGNLPMSGDWSETLDGLFFERRATPSEKRAEPAGAGGERR